MTKFKRHLKRETRLETLIYLEYKPAYPIRTMPYRSYAPGERWETKTPQWIKDKWEVEKDKFIAMVRGWDREKGII